MEPRVRVLVVDDSAVVRRMLTELLSADPELEVVGTAPNAALAMRRLEQSLPDVVTLDVEMPDVSGLELLAQIRTLAPKLPVVMFSSLTQRAASTTLEALARGASDYVTKPQNAKSREEANEHVRAQLIPRLKALVRGHGTSAEPPPRPPPVRTAELRSTRVELVAIGCSTGGPNALSEIFRQLPVLPVPVVLVQHMPPLFTRLLAERLSTVGPMRVREAVAGEALRPGEAIIAPGDFHLRVVRDGASLRAALDQGPQENSCRPAVDVLFRSLAKACGKGVLAVVLTGMGQDGLRGGEELRAAGGRLLAQDEATSVVWGMPGFGARAGLCEAVVPLPELANEISARVNAAQARAPRSTSEVTHAGH